MKKILLTALALGAMLSAGARTLEVGSIQRVPGMNVPSEIATVSPDGSFAIVGAGGSSALYRVDLTTGASTLVTDNGRPTGVAITPDGQNVVFRAMTTKGKLRYTSLEQVNLADGRQTQLVKPSRTLNAGVSVANGSATAVNNGRMQAKGLPGGKARAQAVASIDYGHLTITDAHGVSRHIDPQGRGSYLWPSISPDGTKVLYFIVGKGTFVADLDGSNSRYIGYMQSPSWLGNDMAIGMEADGTAQQITSSRIVAYDMDGRMQELTGRDIVALYPSASADGTLVIFSDNQGNLYKMNLK